MVNDEELAELQKRYLTDAAFHARVELLYRLMLKHDPGDDAWAESPNLLELTAELEVLFLGTLEQVGWLDEFGVHPMEAVFVKPGAQPVWLVK